MTDEHFAKGAQEEFCAAPALQQIAEKARNEFQQQTKNPSACEGFLAVATAGEKSDWAMQGSNLRLPPCEDGTHPLFLGVFGLFLGILLDILPKSLSKSLSPAEWACEHDIMAAKTSARSLKGYNEKTHTWDWWIGGKRFYTSCASLGLPESEWTQEKSRAAAWGRYQELAGLRAEEQAEVRAKNDANLDAYLKMDRIAHEQERLMITMAEDPTFLPPQETRPSSPPPAPDKTIKYSVERYVAVKIDDARSGNRSAGGADNIRRFLSELVKNFGHDATFDAITFDAWEKWQRYCQSHKTEHWKSAYNNSKTFLAWCDQKDLVQLPKNFYNKIKFVFERPEIKTYSDAEIVRILEAANGNLKLCLLLMLNAGMQSKDIGDLKKSEIDLKKGKITRKRSKTKDKPNTPLVTYPLWRSTLKMLRKLINQDPDCILALTTKSGGKWNYRELQENGKLKRSDNINTLWQNLEAKVGQIGTLGRFKKSSATKIKNNPKYANCEIMFLGHTERNMSGQHYAKITPERLSAAVKWLGDEWHQN